MALEMIPIAFRIRDFRSIVDSGICALSGDGITVLAGQNESGKTAVLSALRDFDLEEGQLPVSKDYLPEGRLNATPSVSVQFALDVEALSKALLDEQLSLPNAFLELARNSKRLWITRDLSTGQYQLEQAFLETLEAGEDASPADSTDDKSTSAIESNDGAAKAIVVLRRNDTCSTLRTHWPAFVYFDSFQDALPRDIAVASLAVSTKVINGKATPLGKAAPQAVQDFVTLSGLDLALVNRLAGDNKALGNYLRKVGATITGDFLTYWKQTAQGKETVDLQVRHFRDEAGTLSLAFYVHDRVDQYLDQRSKGFLWFLSFYLRLAAAHKRDREPNRLLLIDEPGTYLHA